MSRRQVTDTALHRYVELDEGFYAVYETYQPDLALIRLVNEALPSAHVVSPGRYSCPDCTRNIPQMARIAEYLPGWTWEIFPDSDTARKKALGILRIPTFIVYDGKGGYEIGRIIENPTDGSLEADLLRITHLANR